MKKLAFLIPVIAGTALLLSACGSKPGAGSATTDSTAMITARNKQTAVKAIIQLNKHNIDSMFADCAADYMDYNTGETKPAKVDSAKASLKDFVATFPDMHGENFVALAQGDTVAVFATWSGTFKGPMGTMKPTGKSFKINDVDILTFNKDGKITSHRSLVPFSVYFSQVGAGMK